MTLREIGYQRFFSKAIAIEPETTKTAPTSPNKVKCSGAMRVGTKDDTTHTDVKVKIGVSANTALTRDASQ